MERTIEINVNDQYLKNLKAQKRLLLALNATLLMPNEFEDEIEGVIGMMDEIQDKAVNVGFKESKVFDLHSNKKSEEKFTKLFNEKVESFRDEIIICSEFIKNLREEPVPNIRKK